MINIKNIELIWNKLINDLDGDDIVLEIKILSTTIGDYNNLLRSLSAFYTFPIKYTLGGKNEILPLMIDDKFFDDDRIKDLKIDLGKITLTNSFFEINEIEFYTNSVLNLNIRDVVTLFAFIEWLGEIIKREVLIFIESWTTPSVSYDFKDKLYKTYIYSDIVENPEPTSPTHKS